MTFASEPPKELRSKIEAIGNVKEVQETSSKGMYAWLLEKNGKTLVLYNTPDNKHFIKGTIYDLDSKKIVSDKHALASLKFASKDFREKVLIGKTTPTAKAETTSIQNDAFSIGFMNLKWNKKEVPEALTLIDSLAGAREGKGLPQDTLYIFYDPNCIWCHRTYDGLRPYVAKGYTIKWLPTVARGKTPQSLALASAPLQNPKLLGASFNKESAAKVITPTPANEKAVDTNLQFLMAYFKKVMPEQRTSVPLALFLDKTTGKITHLQGLPDKPVIEVLFGEK